jgi:hypothetical protein
MKDEGISRSGGRGSPKWLGGPALAVMLCLATGSTSARAAGVSVQSATQEQASAASEKYRAGMELFGAQKYADALEVFRKSYDVVASPNTHLMIGRTLSRMGKLADAYREIDATVAEADAAALGSDKYKKTAEAARAELDDLKTKVGFLVVNLATTVSVGGRQIQGGELGRPIVLEPGSTEVVLSLPSGETEKQEVRVQPGTETRVDLAPPPAKTVITAAPCPPLKAEHGDGIDQRTLAWVAGGVGLAGFATFGVFGVLDDKKYSDLKDQCPQGVCPRNLSSEAETGRTYQTLANVGLGVGIVGIGTGLVLFLTAPSSHPERVASSLPDVSVGPRSVELRGRF